MKDRSDDPSHHERTLLPRSYISRPPATDYIVRTIAMIGLDGVIALSSAKLNGYPNTDLLHSKIRGVACGRTGWTGGPRCQGARKQNEHKKQLLVWGPLTVPFQWAPKGLAKPVPKI